MTSRIKDLHQLVVEARQDIQSLSDISRLKKAQAAMGATALVFMAGGGYLADKVVSLEINAAEQISSEQQGAQAVRDQAAAGMLNAGIFIIPAALIAVGLEAGSLGWAARRREQELGQENG